MAPKFTDNDKSEFDPVDLGRTYFQRKRLQEEQDKFRKEFFQYATDSFAPEDLAQQMVEIPEDQIDSPREYIEKYYPDWIVTDSELVYERDEKLFVAIRENPELKSFTKIIKLNSWDIKSGKAVFGYVISRSVSSGQTYVDDERLKKVDPDLYWEVTEWAYSDLLAPISTHQLSSEDLENANWPRVVKGPDELTPAELDALKPYLYLSPSTAKLLVRYAKEDESEE